MKKLTYKYFLLLLIGFTFSFNANAGLPVSMYYLENIPQSNLLNPAMNPRTNVFVGLPALGGINYSMSSELSANLIFQEYGGRTITPLKDAYDFNPLYKRIGNAADIENDITVTPIIFGWRTKKGYITIGVTDKISTKESLPKALFEMEESGTPDGSKFDFGTFQLRETYHRELSVGYSRQLSQRLTVGMHAKALFGLAAITTDINKFQLNTSQEEWTYDMDATVHGSFPGDVYMTDGIIDSVVTPDMDGDVLVNQFGTNFSNPGVGIDIGAVYEYNNWVFSAAINDIGFIKWKSELNNLTTKGEYSFEGLDGSLEDIENEDFLNDFVDSLANTLQFTHDSTNSFTTYLTPHMFLGAAYNVNHYLTVGVLSKSLFIKDNFHQEFNFSANFNLYKAITTSFNYNISLKGYSSLGFALGLRAGPAQLYMMADYVPYKFGNYNIESDDGEFTKYTLPERNDRFSFMFGINLLFGANGFQNDPMVDAYSEF